MSKSVSYYAQPYLGFGRPVPAALPFACALDAEEGGRILVAGGAVGAVVYELWGDAEAGIWDEPDILAIFGDVPRGVLAIDPDGPEPWAAESVAA